MYTKIINLLAEKEKESNKSRLQRWYQDTTLQ